MEAKNTIVFPAETLDLVQKIMKRYPEGKHKSAILPILHLAQAEWKWCSPEVMDYVASLLSIAPVEVYEVASFYTCRSEKEPMQFNLVLRAPKPLFFVIIVSAQLLRRQI